MNVCLTLGPTFSRNSFIDMIYTMFTGEKNQLYSSSTSALMNETAEHELNTFSFPLILLCSLKNNH